MEDLQDMEDTEDPEIPALIPLKNAGNALPKAIVIPNHPQ